MRQAMRDSVGENVHDSGAISSDWNSAGEAKDERITSIWLQVVGTCEVELAWSTVVGAWQ